MLINKPRLTNKVLKGIKHSIEARIQELPDMEKDEESSLRSAKKWIDTMLVYRSPRQRGLREIAKRRRNDPIL